MGRRHPHPSMAAYNSRKHLTVAGQRSTCVVLSTLLEENNFNNSRFGLKYFFDFVPQPGWFTFYDLNRIKYFFHIKIIKSRFGLHVCVF